MQKRGSTCKFCGKTGFTHMEQLDFHILDEHVEPNALEMYYGIRRDANIRAPDHNRYVGRKVAAPASSAGAKRGGFSGTGSGGARARTTTGGCPLCGGDVQHDVKAVQFTGERRDASDLMFGDRHTTTKHHGAYCVNCGLAVHDHDGDKQT